MAMLDEGIVTGRDDASGAYTVSCGGPELTCQFMQPVVSKLVGIQFRWRIPVGTAVRVLKGEPSWILGVLPSENSDLDTRHMRRLFPENGEPDGEGTEEAGYVGDNFSGDLLDGEIDMRSTMGAAIQLLTSFARLTAGDRAVVETCVLNDMVRIVSGEYRHHAASGDTLDFNDGRLNREEGATSYPHEAAGAEEQGDPLFAMGEDGLVDVESVAERARWRFHLYRGFLGDFVHAFVTDPLRYLGDAAMPAHAGKARAQIMGDGTVLVQSVAEICLERSCRVLAPVRVKAHDAADGMLASEADRLDRSLLRAWEGFKSAEGLADTAFQLREYARWLSSLHSLSRFLQANKDFRVDKETVAPSPDWNNLEKDRTETNGTILGYYDTYACFRIMRDGAIVLWAGDGSTFVMAEGDILCHASRNMLFAAAGDIRFRAGRDVVMTARRHMVLSAVVGAFKLKARTSLDMLCEWGRFWIKSDADPERDEDYYNSQKAHADDPDPELETHGVLIEAPKAGTMVRAAKELRLMSDNTGEGAKGVLIDAPQATVELDSRLTVVRGRTVVLRAASNIYQMARGWFAEITGSLEVAGRMRLSPGGVLTSSQQVKAEVVVSDGLRENLDAIEETTRPIPAGDLPEPGDGFIWDYDLPLAMEGKGRETLTEQFLRENLPESLEGSYQDIDPDASPDPVDDRWKPEHCALKRTSRTTGSGTFLTGGESAVHTHTGGEDLRQPSDTAPAAFRNKPTGYNKRKAAWRCLKG